MYESETSSIISNVSTNGTTQHLFFSIPIVITSDGTFVWSLALWQLLFRVLAHIFPTALLFMTRLTEVCVSPTEPLCNTTAEFTFEFNKILTVFRTILNRDLTTISTD